MLKSTYQYNISLYSRGDCLGVSALLSSNTVACGGTLTSSYSPEDIEKMAQDHTIVVARLGTEVVGVLMALDKRTDPLKPLWVRVLEIWGGTEDAYLYGPVCVSPDHKGRRLVARLWECMQEATEGREAILSIKASNEASLRAHRRLGMQEVGLLPDAVRGDRLVFTSRPTV